MIRDTICLPKLGICKKLVYYVCKVIGTLGSQVTYMYLHKCLSAYSFHRKKEMFIWHFKKYIKYIKNIKNKKGTKN